MKKYILIICLLIVSCGVNAEVLTGGIKYTAQDAKLELQNNRPSGIDYILANNNYVDKNRRQNLDALLNGVTKLNDRTLAIFSDKSYGVNYNKDPLHVWYYAYDGNLIYSEEKSSLNYPYRTYKYTPDGDLINMSMRVSEGEAFIFSPQGELLGHWIGKNCYDKNGKVIMTRKILK
ncbi:hypothetical protein J6G99_05505 [bacterium]|nr:hypothetical protein [bacterium]